MELVYSGPFDAVEVEVAPEFWVVVKQGEPYKFSDSLADRLLEQDCWTVVLPTKTAPTAKKPPQPKK